MNLNLTELLNTWDFRLSESEIVLESPSQSEALRLIESSCEAIASLAKKFGAEAALIRYKGGNTPYRIPVKMAVSEDWEKKKAIATYLESANYRKLLEFLIEQKEAGKIVILTSQVTDICIHTNDNLLPSRAYWSPVQFTGYNYLRSWSLDGKQPSEEYHALRRLLNKDGFIPGYQYRLIRPDGALCEYQTDFYHVENYCGEPIRVGVSDPSAYSVLSYAN